MQVFLFSTGWYYRLDDAVSVKDNIEVLYSVNIQQNCYDQIEIYNVQSYTDFNFRQILKHPPTKYL